MIVWRQGCNYLGDGNTDEVGVSSLISVVQLWEPAFATEIAR